MPYAFAFIGLILVVAGLNNKLGDMVDILKSDLVGTNSFIYWLVAIFVIGAIGTIKPLKPVSTGLLVLVVLVLILANGQNGRGLFAQLKSQIDQIAQGTGT